MNDTITLWKYDLLPYLHFTVYMGTKSCKISLSSLVSSELWLKGYTEMVKHAVTCRIWWDELKRMSDSRSRSKSSPHRARWWKLNKGLFNKESVLQLLTSTSVSLWKCCTHYRHNCDCIWWIWANVFLLEKLNMMLRWGENSSVSFKSLLTGLNRNLWKTK